MRVLLFSRYDSLGASSRVRSFQYLSYLADKGIDVTISPLFSNLYLASLYSGKKNWSEVVTGYFRRFVVLFTVYKYDAVWIEKELFPFLPAFFERVLKLCRIKMVVDYDDALFHRYDCNKNATIRAVLGKKIDIVMQLASTVIVGNKYLATRARQAGAEDIVLIPTVVNINKYSINAKNSNNTVRIGWIGTPSTMKYLAPLFDVLKQLTEHYDVECLAVGATQEFVEDTVIKPVKWSENKEVELIQSFDIGLMPLEDSPWERGKCGYKLIQYMACGLPVVASPVGVNTSIVEPSKNGFLAINAEEWLHALTMLINSQQLRWKMGMAGRAMVEKNYDIKMNSEKLITAFKER